MAGGACVLDTDLTRRGKRNGHARIHLLAPPFQRNLHSLFLVHPFNASQAKATLPSPPSPTPVLPPNIAVEAAVAALDAVRPRMAEIFLAAAGAEPPLSKEQQQQEAAAPEARGGATAAAGGPTDPVYGVTAPARALAAALEAAAAAGGRLAYPLGFKGALLQLLWNYVSRNAYGPVQRWVCWEGRGGATEERWRNVGAVGARDGGSCRLCDARLCA